jgi:hypothetical protein
MNEEFDELAKGMAQSVTRRGALKKFGIGVAGVVLASLGLAAQTHAGPPPFQCHCKDSYPFGCQTYPSGSRSFSLCLSYCTNECTKSNGGNHGRGGPY